MAAKRRTSNSEDQLTARRASAERANRPAPRLVGGPGGSGTDAVGSSDNGGARDAAAGAREAGGADVPSGGAGERALAELVRHQLALLGEDPSRAGLRKTPERVAAALRWLTRGYGLSVADVVGDAVFEERHESMIMVRDIELYSLCEHHLLPFFGKVHIAYLPAGRIVGLSKLPRLVEVFARRLQVQERLTEEIAQAVEEVLEPRGVGVVIEAAHLCMMMRGVEKQNSKAITSAMKGAFRDDAKTRDEFLRLAHSAIALD